MPTEKHVSNCISGEGGKVKVMSCSREFWPREQGLCCFAFHLCSCHRDPTLISTMALIAKRRGYYVPLSCSSEGGKSVVTMQ